LAQPDMRGLSSEEALRRLAEDGPNCLTGGSNRLAVVLLNIIHPCLLPQQFRGAASGDYLQVCFRVPGGEYCAGVKFNGRNVRDRTLIQVTSDGLFLSLTPGCNQLTAKNFG